MVRLSVFQSLGDPDASIVCIPPLNIPVVSKPGTHNMIISFRALFLFLAFLLAFTMLSTSVHAASGNGDVQFVQDVGPVLFPGLIEGFETSWDGWEADNGVWEIGVPTSGPPADSQGNRAHEGTNVLATVLDDNYPRYTDERAISPVFEVPAAADNPRLRFWHWFSTYDANDKGYVEVREVGTTDWVKVSEDYHHTSGAWTQAQVDLSAYAGKSIQVAFHFQDDGGDTGWPSY